MYTCSSNAEMSNMYVQYIIISEMVYLCTVFGEHVVIHCALNFHFFIDYDAMYKKSIEDPEPFWSEQGNRFLVWDEPFAKADNCSKEKGTISWFAGGKLNVSSKFFSFNCMIQRLPPV